MRRWRWRNPSAPITLGFSADTYDCRLADLIQIKCHCKAFAISATRPKQSARPLKPALNARA
jgi:hypothetical protein